MQRAAHKATKFLACVYKDARRVLFSFVPLVTLLGCVPVVAIPEAHYQQALAQVDAGTLHLRAQEWEAAEAAFVLAWELAPLAAAVDGRGCVALLLGDFEKAEQLFRQAYEMDSTYEEALANLALLYDLRGQPARAKELFESFLDLRPGIADARNNYAAVLDAMGTDRAVVVHELRKALALQGNEIVKRNITKLVPIRGR